MLFICSHKIKKYSACGIWIMNKSWRHSHNFIYFCIHQPEGSSDFPLFLFKFQNIQLQDHRYSIIMSPMILPWANRINNRIIFSHISQSTCFIFYWLYFYQLCSMTSSCLLTASDVGCFKLRLTVTYFHTFDSWHLTVKMLCIISNRHLFIMTLEWVRMSSSFFYFPQFSQLGEGVMSEGSEKPRYPHGRHS